MTESAAKYARVALPSCDSVEVGRLVLVANQKTPERACAVRLDPTSAVLPVANKFILISGRDRPQIFDSDHSNTTLA